jgi:hypothetical protein
VNSDSCGVDATAEPMAAPGRSTSDSTEATGCPVWSASVMDTVSAESGLIRTRTVVASVACSSTPVQAKGRPAATSTGSHRAIACRAASSTAGWMPKPAASVPDAWSRPTSAKTSSPSRHAARRPWNAGP